MIDLHYAPTPNGWKITIMLAECGLPYNLKPVNLMQGDQFQDDFLRISPNNRMPAIVDSDTGISIFESGAILIYLAEKTGRFYPTEMLQRFDVLQWLFWQVGGVGPMAGQLSHFVNYAPGGPEQNEYAHTRYKGEYDRLFSVMERVLANKDFLAGDYSIADMATFPWILPYKRFGQSMDAYPGVQRWYEHIKERPAVRAGVEVGKVERTEPSEVTEEQRRRLFSQSGASVTKAIKQKQ